MRTAGRRRFALNASKHVRTASRDTQCSSGMPARASVLVQPRKQLEEDFLRQVLFVRPFRTMTPHNANDQRVKRFDQRDRRIRVVLPHSFEALP